MSIEGMAPREGGGVWIGFRNPNPGGKALLASLLNPAEVVHGVAARFASAALLDLGGRGVRAMARWRDGYLIMAGAYDATRSPKLFAWDGAAPAHELVGDDLSWLNPEAFFVAEQRRAVMALSDDGTRKIDGVECKRLTDASRKEFRGLWLALPGGATLRPRLARPDSPIVPSSSGTRVDVQSVTL